MRIEVIASLVTKDVSVIDIGTDHGYVPIYLYQNNITHKITASDISTKVINNTLNNLKKYHLEDKIELVVSDGFKNIDKKYDEAIITGMGTNSIIDILTSSNNIPDSLIIGSQKNTYELRIFMQEFGYKIVKEVVIKEKGIYYVIIKYNKGIDNLNELELLLGKSNNQEYFDYLKNKYIDIYNKSHNKKYLDIIEKIPG